MKPDAVPRRRDWTIAACTAAVALVVSTAGALLPLERPVADLLLRLPHPGRLGPSSFAAAVIDDDAVTALGPLPWPRSEIANLVDLARRHGARAVVLDVLASEPGTEAGDAALERALAEIPSALVAALTPDGTWLLPLDRFGGVRRAAHGHAEVASDGVVRSISATKQAAGISLPALSAAAAALAGRQAAIEPGTLIRPDFRRAPDDLPVIGAAELLAADDAAGLLAGRTVFIGVTAAGAGDQFVIPSGGRRPVPGVLVHAIAADALLRGGLVRPAPPWHAAVLALGAVLLAQWSRTRAGRLRLRTLAVIGLVCTAAAVGWLWGLRLQLPLVTLLGAVAAAAAAREALESGDAQRETGRVLESLLLRQGGRSSQLPSGVTGRLQLARRLQEQMGRDRDLRRALLEGMGEGVAMWDGDGRVLLANGALDRLWGGEPSLAEVEAVTGAAPGRDEASRGEVERAGRALEVELRALEAGTLGLIRDVSARRELDRRRRETQRLVSHELKTPLASISGFGAMLERYALDREEQLRVAGLIRGEADRLGRMVATFLDLERLGSGRLEAARAPVDLAALTERRCELLAAAAAGRSQTLEVMVQRATVLGAEELLDRLLDNLVGNALKYSPPGSTVTVQLTEGAGSIVLAVRDQGPGIPPAAIPHLFERFFRVPGTEAAGSGLGLALVREVAEWHGAEVHVDSEPGRGSTFTVLFNAAREGS